MTDKTEAPVVGEALTPEGVTLLRRGDPVMVISERFGEWTGGVWPYVGQSGGMIDLEHPRFGVGSFFPSELSRPAPLHPAEEKGASAKASEGGVVADLVEVRQWIADTECNRGCSSWRLDVHRRADCDCGRETALAALTRAEAAQTEERGWQPIETAPRDGTLIMVGASGCGVSLVRWTLDSWIDEQGFTQGSWPTHWMPLPSAPTPPGEAQ